MLAGFAIFGSAQAAVVTYDFTAKVTWIIESLSPPYSASLQSVKTLTGATISKGQEIRGTFSYDTAMAVNLDHPLPPVIGNDIDYSDINGTTKIKTLNVSTVSPDLIYEMNSLNVTNGGRSSEDVFSLVHVGLSSDFDLLTSSIQLYDPSGTALDNSGVPQSLTLSSFGLARYDLSYTLPTGRRIAIQSEMTMLTPAAAVPEPATYALLLGGLAVIGWNRRKRV